jgi:hypothetical protein
LISISFFILVVSVSASSIIVYSTDNHYSAEVTNANTIVFREDGQEIWSSKTDSPIRSIAISPNGDYIAVGCDGGIIYFYLMDWSVTLLWKRTFGDSSITSISFQENSNFIEASNSLNQAFLITRTGNLVSGLTKSTVTVNPSVGFTTPYKDSVPGISDPNRFLGIDYLTWIIIVLIVLVVLWAIRASHQKTGTSGTYQPPPQNGVIYIDSIPRGAAIYFDGIYTGVSPLTLSNIIPAIHTIKATLNGYYPETQRLNLSVGQTFVYSPSLRKIPPTPPKPPKPPVYTKTLQDLIAQLGAKAQKDREEAQKQLIIKVNTEGKPMIQQIIKELETRPSTIKREIINLLYYLCKEGHDGQKVTEELINALTYSSSDVKWLIIQTLGRLKDKRAQHALEAAVSDSDFLVRYWAIISLKNIQES